ncbi:hypothetical protein D9615_001596 [Tricholomella constricta]|uniref:Small ribosomal subunit protein mS38 n=1 Tax=Tricholomella constricta TaxID=117010 RepID=A0A8H5HP51_9AGAR|nr:hypothetical protein D9615_001596 [Tricholomella constricta]
MSALSRLLHRPPAAQRAYSSFFSSKSGGGGRYFNSPKPPKVVVTAKAEPTSEPAADGTQSPASINSKADQPSKSPSSSSSSSSSTSPASAPASSSTTDAPNKAASLHGSLSNSAFLQRPQHPVVNAKDFKLHQFFSLHRPLLLLAHPTSIFERTSATTLFDSAEATTVQDNSSTTSQWLLDEFPEATADADAAAARQLTRALTMSHGGAAVAWEDTLRRLGLDVDKEADRVGLRQQWDREWQEVMMDSVKRKRRKKMKKHKLKKRRKATRATRLKIGR